MRDKRDPYPADPGPKKKYTPRRRFKRGLFLPPGPRHHHQEIYKPGDVVLLNAEKAAKHRSLVDPLPEPSPAVPKEKKAEAPAPEMQTRQVDEAPKVRRVKPKD